jgi:hypothetical protein
MPWTFKAQKIGSFPMKAWDNPEEPLKWINLFYGENGAIFYNFDSDIINICPLNGENIEEYISVIHDWCNLKCDECLNTEYFVVLEGENIPKPVNYLKFSF